jgi:hypothetical protein
MVRYASDLVLLLEKTPVLWAVSVSGIAALVSVLPENVEKCKKNEKMREERDITTERRERHYRHSSVGASVGVEERKKTSGSLRR